jgi:hypothetical protein
MSIVDTVTAKWFDAAVNMSAGAMPIARVV